MLINSKASLFFGSYNITFYPCLSCSFWKRKWLVLRYVTPITDKENKRAKSECSFALFCFLNYRIIWVWLDFELGFGLTLGLEFGLGLGLGLGLESQFSYSYVT